MLRNGKQTKYCNCTSSSDKEILKNNIEYSFCEKCGCILLKGQGGIINYTLKAKQKRLPLDISPIDIIRHMKIKTEEDYPFINEEYNINKDDKNKERILRAINVYLKHRKMILLKLQKLMKTFDYCDMIFYQCLFYLDTYLSRDITETTTEKKILYYLIGYFLCSVKFKEIDIYEPSLDSFYDLSKGIYLSTDKIAYYEVLCLKTIQYNVFSYSAYDWLSQFISNGIIFDSEINNTNEVILIKGHRHSLVNAINKYAIKLLLNLTAKNLFFKYSPMATAVSIIQIAREKYIDKNMIKKKLFIKLMNTYGIKVEDYIKCYEEIKAEICEGFTGSDKNLRLKEKIKEKENKRKNNEVDNDNNIKNYERNESINNKSTMMKNLYVPNKMNSSNNLVRYKGNDLINNLKEKYNNTNISNNENDESNEKSKDNINNTNIELSLNEFNLIKNNKNNRSNKNIINNIKQARNHLSIDCKPNIYKSNDNLPFVSFNNQNNGYSFLTIYEEKEKESQNRNGSYSNKKIKHFAKELNHVKTKANRFKSIASNNISAKENLARSLEKVTVNGNAKIKKSKFFNPNNDDNNIEIESKISKKTHTSTKLPSLSGFEKKVYKLKNRDNNNVELKTNLDEEEIKRIKNAKKVVEVY